VGSFVGQFGASLCRPDFGAVIISCNVIYWHLPVTAKMKLPYSVRICRFSIQGEREVPLHLHCAGSG
jgi:hypothetical protein